MENICVCTNSYSNHVIAIISPNNRALTELAAKLGLKSSQSLAELCRSPKVHRHILTSIQSLGSELGFKIREIPVEITLVSEDWAQANL